jgi:glycine/D-amino acid oxidase-like deaminating enzyme
MGWARRHPRNSPSIKAIQALRGRPRREVGADDWDPPATDAELLPVSEALAELVPGAAGPVVERDICLYTLPADQRPDKGEEFIIDRWPNSRLIVASPCSSHGAKFAPAIGEVLARLAIDPAYEVEPFFRLCRGIRGSRAG